MTKIPPGFSPIINLDGFLAHNRTLFGRRDPDGIILGFRVEPHHCNPLGQCHGGWLAAFADVFLALTARSGAANHPSILTVHIDVDYFAPTPLGAWVEGHGRLLRRTTRLAFVDGVIKADGENVTRASGVFRIGPDTALGRIAMASDDPSASAG